MIKTKNDAYYLEKIIFDLEFIIKNTKWLTQREMESNELLIDSIMFRIIQIAENNAKLSDSFKADYPDIPWGAIKGMRNRIVHDYGDVSMLIVYDTVINGIPEMYNLIKEKIRL